jgi:hypothetical protein
MGVRLENFGNFNAKLIRFGQHSVGRLHRRIATALIEIEDRIDDPRSLWLRGPTPGSSPYSKVRQKNLGSPLGGCGHDALLILLSLGPELDLSISNI